MAELSVIRETVRERYARAATESARGAHGEARASLGCGGPTAVADLHEGEIVLDLGSGAGADVLISARRVAPTGRAISLDMPTRCSRSPAPTPRRLVSKRRAHRGLPRADAAPRRERRRRCLQLRAQPLRRQTPGDLGDLLLSARGNAVYGRDQQLDERVSDLPLALAQQRPQERQPQFLRVAPHVRRRLHRCSRPPARDNAGRRRPPEPPAAWRSHSASSPSSRCPLPP